MTDNELFRLCKKFGSESLKWRWKFIGLLPEVHKRRLHEKKGYSSIFEFAAKLAGVSKDQVRRTLNLEKQFEDKPTLHELLVAGEESVNKLARVASIATKENEGVLAERVKKLSQNSIETMVRDYKTENGIPMRNMRAEAVRAHTFQLSEEVQEKLQDLHGQGHDVNELFLEFLRKRNQEIDQEMEEVAATLPEESSRHVPERVKRVVYKKFGEECAICHKKAVVFHHMARFSLSRRHDPRLIAPLCKAHHELAHAVDVKVVEMRK